jgi:hypothetical protein
MSDRVKLAREIAVRSETRFISIPREPKSKSGSNLPRDLKARARAIAVASAPRFIESPRDRFDGTMRARRGGLPAEEYRLMLIRKWGEN